MYFRGIIFTIGKETGESDKIGDGDKDGDKDGIGDSALRIGKSGLVGNIAFIGVGKSGLGNFNKTGDSDEFGEGDSVEGDEEAGKVG